MKKFLFISVVVVSILVLCVGGWWISQRSPDDVGLSEGVKQRDAFYLAHQDEMKDWKVYTLPTFAGYQLFYPADWTVERCNEIKGCMSQGDEVTFMPPDAEPFVGYFSVLKDPRSIAVIRRVLNDAMDPSGAHQFIEEQITVDGYDAWMYTDSQAPDLRQIFVVDRDYVFEISTAKYSMPEVQLMLGSISFAL